MYTLSLKLLSSKAVSGHCILCTQVDQIQVHGLALRLDNEFFYPILKIHTSLKNEVFKMSLWPHSAIQCRNTISNEVPENIVEAPKKCLLLITEVL